MDTGTVTALKAGEAIWSDPAVQKFAGTILGPAFGELGQMVADQARYWRFKNQVRLLRKAERVCREAGLPAHAVDLKTLLPLMQYASIEEDEFLQDMWANLLANAATSSSQTPPAFTEILRQLTHEEARLFDALESMERWDQSEVAIQSAYQTLGFTSTSWNVFPNEIGTPRCRQVEIEFASYQLALANLIRLGLLDRITMVAPDFARGVHGISMANVFAESDFSTLLESRYRISPTGAAFMKACRKPNGDSPSKA